jgi:hypothetical protein
MNQGKAGMAEAASFVFDRRRARRIPLERAARLQPNEWSTIAVDLVDLSAEGFRVRCDAILRVGGYVALEVAGLGRVEARVIWQHHGEFGAKFVRPIDPAHCEWLKDVVEAPPAADEPLEPALSDVREQLARHVSKRILPMTEGDAG